MSIQGWFPLGLAGWISLQTKGLSRVFFRTTKASVLQCSAFFIVQFSHKYMTTGKIIALIIQTFVGKVLSLLVNMLSRFVITFLPRSKRLVISWLQSPSAVILEPKKIKCHCFHCFSINLPWSDGTQPVHSEGDQPWDFFGRNDAKAETPVLWPTHAMSWLIGKYSDAGRDWGQEEKGTIEDEMAGWHHGLDGRESEWTVVVGGGQGGLACWFMGSQRVGHDWAAELNWWDQMLWSSFFECWILSQLFHSPASPSSRGSLITLCFLP